MNQISLNDHHKDALFQIPLFRDLTPRVKETILDRLDYSLYEFSKGEIIARQNTRCKNLMVLLKGKLRVDIIDAVGNEVLIEFLKSPRAFATPHLFSKDNILPATFTVLEEGFLFTATKESVFTLISEEPELLKSFLCITGNCNQCTVTRLKALSHKNVRNRFISYLLELKEPENNQVHMEHNQVQLADFLCMTRPALSKEINKMVKEGLIRINGKEIELLDIPELNRQLLA